MSTAASNPGPHSVALMSPGWPPSASPNGIVTYNATMKDAFEAIGVRATVVVPGAPNGPPAAGALYALRSPGPLKRIQNKVSAKLNGGQLPDPVPPAMIAVARRLARREGLEVLEMEESFGWCGPVARKSGVPVVGRLHGPWFLNGPAVGAPQDAAFHTRVERERLGILACQGITSPSRDVLQQTRRYYGIELPHAEAIPCPIEPLPVESRWRPDQCDPDLVLFIGRFDRHKAGDVMLDAFAQVAAKRPRTRLTFVGPDRGCVADDGRTWSLPDYLERLPGAARERVQWLGYQSHDALPPLRRKAAVTVVCSRYENFGYAVLEGLAFGCPMVVSRTGGLVEMVEHERSALLCEPGDVSSLAAQVLRMLEDRPQAERLAIQGLRNVEERFHPRAVASQTLSYYRQVLGMSPWRSRSTAPGTAVPFSRPVPPAPAGGAPLP
jgi:glycosyltransferase involved in cell wall biosynthesis